MFCVNQASRDVFSQGPCCVIICLPTSPAFSNLSQPSLCGYVGFHHLLVIPNEDRRVMRGPMQEKSNLLWLAAILQSPGLRSLLSSASWSLDLEKLGTELEELNTSVHKAYPVILNYSCINWGPKNKKICSIFQIAECYSLPWGWDEQRTVYINPREI